MNNFNCKSFNYLLIFSVIVFTSLHAQASQIENKKSYAPPPSMKRGCEYNLSKMMSLSQDEFDQAPGKGWRAIAGRNNCDLAAADLISDYIKNHKITSELLYWHEGQLHAFSGDYNGAISIMLHSYKNAKHDETGWNYYVDATISFLKHDKSKFEKYKNKLSEVPPAAGLPMPTNGFIELKSATGSKMKMAWPINIDVLNGLDKCFDKPYTVAYGGVCRSLGSALSK